MFLIISSKILVDVLLWLVDLKDERGVGLAGGDVMIGVAAGECLFIVVGQTLAVDS